MQSPICDGERDGFERIAYIRSGKELGKDRHRFDEYQSEIPHLALPTDGLTCNSDYDKGREGNYSRKTRKLLRPYA